MALSFKAMVACLGLCAVAGAKDWAPDRTAEILVTDRKFGGRAIARAIEHHTNAEPQILVGPTASWASIVERGAGDQE